MASKLGRVPSIRERVEDTLSEHRNELVALLSRYMGQGKGILQPHHLLDELSNVIAEEHGRKLEGGAFFEVLKAAQEAIVLPPFVGIAVRPRPGVWEYVRVNVYDLSVEQLSVAEYLRFKEELVDGHFNDHHYVLELDFEPFNASFPRASRSSSIGNGVQFLNRHLSSIMFRNKDCLEPLLDFLRAHKYKGHVLMVNDRIQTLSRLPLPSRVASPARERRGTKGSSSTLSPTSTQQVEMVMATWSSISVLLVLLSAPGLFFPRNVAAEEIFDVRQHLSTVTRYDVARKANSNVFVTSTVPDCCSAMHLNLVARHGTRSPTKKRIKELDQLAVRLDNLLKVTKETMGDNTEYMQKIPPWLWGWRSPWKGKKKGGELISQGEDELYHLGIRIRDKFPQFFDEEYHPDIFNIRATQVPRASASAVAFGMGLFHGKGNLGPGRHRAFSVICESRASDIWLRFHDTCETYKEFRKSQEPSVEKLKQPILDEITSALNNRYQLNFTKQDISSLWFLCKQEASLLDITSQACGLFNSHEVSLLEWTDDLEVFILKGYGNGVNYHMGVPLLQDVVQSMEQAIVAKEGNHKTYEKARLRFAHAETLVPFTCLLGLFLEGSEFLQIQHDQPLDLPPKPPQKRNWTGSILAPFAGNNMLVLYRCSNDTASIPLAGDEKSKYFVQVLHNEVPVSIPGCGGTDFCPFEVFKEKVINPHLKHDFVTVCKKRPEPHPASLETKSGSFICKLSKFFRWLFFLEDSKVYAHNHEEEL